MIKLENVEVLGWEHAIRGMRNPKNSWERSDSEYCGDRHTCRNCPSRVETGDGFTCALPGFATPILGPNDHKLMMQLADGGPVHAKYRRMITVYLDITAPLYWFKEFDTYKVGTVANSCSTMHKIADKEFEIWDFSFEKLIGKIDDNWDIAAGPECQSTPLDILEDVIHALNIYREKYLEVKTKPMKDEGKRAELTKKYWWQMIQLLPSSYNQKRTVMLNYEVLHNMYVSRKDHKLDEWREFCKWIETLPYSEIITGEVR